jgi:hypothetical protein
VAIEQSRTFKIVPQSGSFAIIRVDGLADFVPRLAGLVCPWYHHLTNGRSFQERTGGTIALGMLALSKWILHFADSTGPFGKPLDLLGALSLSKRSGSRALSRDSGPEFIERVRNNKIKDVSQKHADVTN